MGICASCDAAATDVYSPTAMLILPDGRLQEYAGPIQASQALLHTDLDGHFVCGADDIDFDGRLSPVGPGEALVPGEIHFALPKSKLRRRIAPEEMAALAVRATAALTRINGAGDVDGARVWKAAGERTENVGVEIKRRKRIRSGAGRGRDFVPGLSAIPEY